MLGRLQASLSRRCIGKRKRLIDNRSQLAVEEQMRDPQQLALRADVRAQQRQLLRKERSQIELDMGTGFDALTPLSHHGRTDVPPEAQRNRLLLLGLMTAAGFEFYTNEWWHYQLFNARDYPVVSQGDLPSRVMD